MILYRPVGLQEMALIYDGGMKAFPARLPQQPIFYPVLDLEYARKTASSWNAKNRQFAGYVTQFKVEDKYINRFEKHKAGKSQHQELWVPAEEVEEFNKHIVGHIKVVEAHFGKAFQGFIPEKFGLAGKNAVEQFTELANSYLYKRMDFYLEIKRNHKAVFLNYPFWLTYEFKNPGLKEKVLQAIKEAWLTSFPQIPLANPVPEDAATGKQPDAPARAKPLVNPAHEEIKPVKQKDPSARINPVRREITPKKQFERHPLSEPDEEDSTPVKQKESHSFVNPAREEIAPEKQIDSDDWMDSDDEETTPVEQTDSPLRIDPVDEDILAEEQTDPDDLAELDDEETAPTEQIPSPLAIDPLDDDIISIEQTDAGDLVGPAPEETAPPRRSEAHVVVSPGKVESTLPRQTDSPFARGIELGLIGEYPEAIDELSKAVEEESEHVAAHTSLGVAFQRLEQDDQALTCYETALKIDPIYAEAHYFRANILYTHGDVREAIAGYTIAVGLQPELIEAHRKPAPQDRLTDYTGAPAEIYRIARPARRILQLNRLLESNPGRADLFKERAAQYYRLRNFAQAIADYTSSLAIQPDDASTLHARGVAYDQLGQHERAREDYQQALALDPQLSNAYLQRGVTFGQMGNYRQSIASLTEGIRLAPQNPHGYFNRGMTYFQLGELERAIADFSKAIQLSPRDEDAYYWRGVSREELGRQREAIADYKRFLELSRNPRAREEIEHKLRQWNEGGEKDVTGPRALLNERQKTDAFPPGKPDQALDLYAVIAALGERALHSTWFGSEVECYGEKAQELHARTRQDRPIEGQELLAIASGIGQTVKGDFYALDPGADAHWVYIRAWDGSGFYIEIDDPEATERLKTRLPSLEEVEGAAPPYNGLFVRT